MHGEPVFLELSDAVVMRAGKPILSVDSFRLAAGEHVALLGPNGSGKSTFVSLITREVFPLHRDAAPVRFKGRDRVTLAEVKQCLGVVSATMQDQITVHLPVVDVVAGGLFGALGIPARVDDADKTRARIRALETLALLGVDDLAERDIMTLSTGQARRALIARALVHDPETLVLDEPCAGLDPEGMYAVRASMRTLARAGKGIILVTHYPEDVIPEIQRVVLLKDGAVFADGLKQELFTDGRMSALFGVPLQVKRTMVERNAACESVGCGSVADACADVSRETRAALLAGTGDEVGESAVARSGVVRTAQSTESFPASSVDVSSVDEYFSLVSAY